MNRQITIRSRPPLREVYDALLATWGAQHWWPGRTRFEIIVGAILTQNTAWTNVERAIARLRARRWLSPEALRNAPDKALAEIIRPAGCFNLKTQRLKAFVDFLFREFDGRLDRMFRLPTSVLRPRLLSVPGIGPETADCILLYAGRHPVFVIDAYTRRLLARHRWARPGAPYDTLAARFTAELPRDTKLFNEYHALIVRLGKEHCRARPRCRGCPAERFLPQGGK